MKHVGLLLLSLLAVPLSAQEAVDSLLQVADTTQVVQTRREKRHERVSIFKRIIKSFDDFDTTYIAPNYYNYTAMVQNTNTHQIYSLHHESDPSLKAPASTDPSSRAQRISMGPRPSAKVGPYFGWRWIFLGYTFDLARPKEAGKMSEFSFSLYSSLLGGDFVWIRNHGDFRLRRTEGFDHIASRAFRGTNFSGLDGEVMSLDLYYVFNHRRFSYPAAYNQSTMQRRSQGSWILGFQYSRQNIHFDATQLPLPLQQGMHESLRFNHIKYDSYSLSGGYAYNWVFARHWLLAVSLTPAIGYKKEKGARLTLDTKTWRNFSVDYLGRAGLVWNNSKAFAGLSYITHLYSYRQDHRAVYNWLYYLNVYAGFYFNKRRQYR